MGKNFWITTIGLVLITIIASNLAFLPGPSWLYRPSQILYNGCSLLGLLSLIAVPFGLIVLAIVNVSMKKETKTKYAKAVVLILVIFTTTCFFSSLIITRFSRWQSRHYAISRTEQLLSSIEYYKTQKGHYPKDLIQLVPEYIKEIPRPGIIGILPFRYEHKNDSYNLEFRQNYILGFNWEVVVYNPNDQHTPKGELKELYETGTEHWKYYILD